jgi:type II secretory ATPase GspE/PulE/Tfp pilus assembly ATPase PilB-like protein
MLHAVGADRFAWLAGRLKELGVAGPEQLAQLQQEQDASRERFSVLMVTAGLLRDAEAGRRLALSLGWLPERIDVAALTPQAPAPLTPDLCRVHRLVPIANPSGSGVVLVSDDPLSLGSLAWLQRLTGQTLTFVLVREADVQALQARWEQAPAAGAPASAPAAPPAKPAPSTAPPVAAPPSSAPQRPTAAPSAPPAREPVRTSAAASSSAASSSAPPAAPADASDEPIINLVDSLLAEAVRLRASDIHIEPLADQIRVRYRIDGVLHNVSSPPKALQGPIISRIKIMSSLNIAEKRHPQDGRLQVLTGPKPMDVRISLLPALHGESIVMRLLSRNNSLVSLPALGLAEGDGARWAELIRRPYGMVLVTGPTGSGKTTTLYATLGHLNQPDRKLITIEDPVEYQLVGINQVSVKPAIGLTFAAGLRAMLRQAPDVIMVGEIRDAETAQIAIQAALTGHLVFSTLHTNDSPSAVTRLMDMGIAPFLVASTIQGAMAQRLVRSVCPSCVTTRAPTAEEAAFLGDPPVEQVREGKGCDDCRASGYKGRVGIYELLVMTDSLRHLIVSKSQASRLKEQALRDGMRTLRDDGKRKVREGHTTMTEVLRATPDAA